MISANSHRVILCILIFCQFAASMSALGIPPFLSQILQKSFHSEKAIDYRAWAGLLYTFPTLFSGFATPFWGYLSDRFGKKRLLLRAQVGLTLSFLLAGLSTSPHFLLFALALQGIMGGTFAATKAYFTTFLKGADLTRALTYLEVAPRASMIIAPPLIGSVLAMPSPIKIYLYICILPAICSLVTLLLPSDSVLHPPHSIDVAKVPISISQFNSFQPQLLIFIQFVFNFASVISAPYFTVCMQTRFSHLQLSQIGILFGIPHFIFLAFAGPLSYYLGYYLGKELVKKFIFEYFLLAIFIQSISYIGQIFSKDLGVFVFWRGVMGCSNTCAFILFNSIIAYLIQTRSSGKFFGWLEGSVRISTILAGVTASIGYRYLGSNSLFAISSGILWVTLLILIFRHRPHWKASPV